jgi:hypothetical protein
VPPSENGTAVSIAKLTRAVCASFLKMRFADIVSP